MRVVITHILNMALPNPKVQEFKNYLKTSFALKEPWVSTVFETTYSYDLIKGYMTKLSKTDPDLHRLLGWIWASNRHRSDVASGLYMDPSTLKRKQDKAIYIIFNYLNNGDIDPALTPIDLIHQDSN